MLDVVLLELVVVVGTAGSEGGEEGPSVMGGPVVVVVVVGVVDWGDGVLERSFLSIPGRLLFAVK